MQVRRQRAQFTVLLTSYELLLGAADGPRLAQLRWAYVIVDEGQRLKNFKCKLNAAMRQYRSKCRLLITGGPSALQAAEAQLHVIKKPLLSLFDKPSLPY